MRGGARPRARAPRGKLAVPSAVRATAGDLENHLTWVAEADKKAARFRIYRAPAALGPYAPVGEATGASRAYRDPIAVDELGVYHYRVAALDNKGRAGPLSRVAAADSVSIATPVDPFSATAIIASTGELRLDIPAGAVPAPVVVTIEGAGPTGVMTGTHDGLTGRYRFGPDGLAFHAGARPRLTLGYREFAQGDAFEAEWVAQTARLFVYDPAAAAWADVSSGLAVDTQADTVASDVSHFSEYAAGFTVQPHGRYQAGTPLCSTCHNAHRADGTSALKRENTDLCYYCHGAPASTQTARATHGPNIQAAFFSGSDQTTTGHSYHPVRQGKLFCVDCHDPHNDPDTHPRLLYFWDGPSATKLKRYWLVDTPSLAGGTNVLAAAGSGVGSKVCVGCHGPYRNRRMKATPGAPETASDNYWLRTGGDLSRLLTSKHGTSGVPYSPPARSADATCDVSTPSSTEIQCKACHADHGQAGRPDLLKLRINDTTVTVPDKRLCFACHPGELGSYEGSATYNLSAHKGGGVSPAKCTFCHDPHGKPGIPSFLASSEEEVCYECHAGSETAPCNQCHKPAFGLATPDIAAEVTKTLRKPIRWSRTTVRNRGDWIYSIASADFDGDGDLDVVSAGSNGQVQIHTNTSGDGSAWSTVTTFAVADLLCATAGDADGDGDPDIVTGSASPDKRVRLYRNIGGTGTIWAESEVYRPAPANATFYDVRFADVDRDQDQDIVSCGYNGANLYWHNNTAGDGSTWTASLVAAVWGRLIDVGDADGDGDPDVVGSAIGVSGGVRYHRNNSNGTSWTTTEVRVPKVALSVAFGDVDGDADLDIGAVFDQEETITAYRNVAGDGSAWTTMTALAYGVFPYGGWSPQKVEMADFTGSGKAGIFYGTRRGFVYQSENVAASGTQWYTSFADTGYDNQGLHAVDLDRDGDQDLVIAEKAGTWGAVVLLRNIGRTPEPGSHPVGAYSGRHAADETSVGVGAGNRHAECADCHNTHVAYQGTHTLGTNLAPAVLDGARGVAVSNVATWSTPVYSEVESVTYEYEVCFRCHSSYTSGYAGADKALQFNTLNRAFHPVEGPGRNIGVRDGSFTQGTPWNPTAGDDADYSGAGPPMTCTDCHSSDAASGPRGPHGSVWDNLLARNATMPDTADWSNNDLCYACHDKTVYTDATGWSLGGGSVTYTAGPPQTRITHPHFYQYLAYCVECHQPHGTDREHLMRIDYSHTPTGGVIQQFSQCQRDCHGGASKSYQTHY